MTVWWLGTVGHFLLTSTWLKRADTSTTRDEHWFQTMVAGTGTLSIALHLLACTVGLSVSRVLLLLLAGHAAAAWNAYSAPLKGRPAADSAPRPTPIVTRVLETAAMVLLTAVVLQWILIALKTGEVSGSDAAHYHVPNAINMALGASPFNLPATGHLYPMGSSTLAAWFILPLNTPLLTDLVMVLPFLLLVSAAGWLFRQLTGLSGLAWSTWMMLALFGTPLFRSASLMSADLLFAAALMAFGAAVLAPLLRRRFTPADIWLIGLTLGLLLGSKATGIVGAALLGLPALLAVAALRVRGKRLALASVGSALAVVGAGGIWLIRNWWVWGSPVAPNSISIFGLSLFSGTPYEPTTYLSVLGDLKDQPDYQLWERSRHFIATWLSSWFLVGLGAMALIPVDAFISRRRGVLTSARVAVMIVACVSSGLMAWFLIGAPWTSLEWTAGFSLRYALPWLAMLPFVAWVALFPECLPWYRRTIPAALGALAITAGGLAIFGGNQPLPFPPLPTPGVLITAVAIVGARYALQVVSPRWRWALAIGVAVRAAILLDVWATQADTLAQETRAAAIVAGPRTNGERIFDAAVSFEAKGGHSCDAEGRRFFVTNRFDEAGTLQGPRLRNQVFYAARDVRVTARVRPSMGPCDYILTERAIMDTDKGAMLHAGLNTSGRLVEVDTIGDVVLLVHR